MQNEFTRSGHMEPQNLALAVLGWILGDGPRAERLLDLTGLTPDLLRERLGDPGVLAAVLEFLINHEPDLVRASDELQITPQQIVAAHESLSR
ncbi:DUF3572 domain-containing protein [Pontixanthobacter gangjinensis]